MILRRIRHPLVRRDVRGIFDHVLETTAGDLAAAERRLDEIDELLRAIAANPASGLGSTAACRDGAHGTAAGS